MTLVISGRAPAILPVDPFLDRQRETRDCFVTTEDIVIDGRWIPCGYVTDFGSIPPIATIITLILQFVTLGLIRAIKPLGRHGAAALGHDFAYAVGEPGKRKLADQMFLARMKVDGVPLHRRMILYWAVRLGGWIGYRQAPSWWETENFADPETGLPVPPPFAREEAFDGQPFGLRSPA